MNDTVAANKLAKWRLDRFDAALAELRGALARLGDWRYDAWPSREPNAEWPATARGDSDWDARDFHVDLGCGTIPKGRIGIDRYEHENVDLVLDLEREPLPFADSSIRSIITHHFLEHMGLGFIPLMDECHRVLEFGGLMRVIVPLFPGHSAVADPDHKRYFCLGTFESFEGTTGEPHWSESFSVPYTKARFQIADKDADPLLADPVELWGMNGARELRVALVKR